MPPQQAIESPDSEQRKCDDDHSRDHFVLTEDSVEQRRKNAHDREFGAEVAWVCWAIMTHPRNLRMQNIETIMGEVASHHQRDRLAPVVIIPSRVGKVVSMQD